MSVRTTKKQFRLFEREARKWLDKLGLKAWFVDMAHTDLEDGCTVACCSWKSTNRCATLLFNLKMDENPTDAVIRRFALHECLELLLSDCTNVMWRASCNDIVERETHAVIRSLENVLLEVKR